MDRRGQGWLFRSARQALAYVSPSTSERVPSHSRAMKRGGLQPTSPSCGSLLRDGKTKAPRPDTGPDGSWGMGGSCKFGLARLPQQLVHPKVRRCIDDVRAFHFKAWLSKEAGIENLKPAP